MACDVANSGAVVGDVIPLAATSIPVDGLVVTNGKSFDEVAIDVTDPSWFWVYKIFLGPDDVMPVANVLL